MVAVNRKISPLSLPLMTWPLDLGFFFICEEEPIQITSAIPGQIEEILLCQMSQHFNYKMV